VHSLIESKIRSVLIPIGRWTLPKRAPRHESNRLLQFAKMASIGVKTSKHVVAVDVDEGAHHYSSH
jgi:hypothetical protein